MAFDPTQCTLFDGFEDRTDVLRRLKPEGRSFAEGEWLVQMNEHANCMWIILDGTVSIHADLGSTSHTVVHRHEGEIVGEQGIILQEGRRTAAVKAATPVDVLIIYKDAFDELPAFMQVTLWKNLARIVSAKLAQSTAKRGSLVATNANSRQFLERLVNRDGLAGLAAGPTTLVDDQFETRTLVLWFSDLVGFSKIAEACTEREIAELIGSATSVQADLIEEAGGYIDKFIGDAVMGYWVVRGNNHAAAAQTAFRIAEMAAKAVHEIRSPVDGAPLGVRIGLHIGRAKVGNFGSKTRWAWTAIGDAVNLAARHEQVHQGVNGESLGPIRVSQDLYALLSDEQKAALPNAVEADAKGRRFILYTASHGDQQ